jgi:hypothetical protein
MRFIWKYAAPVLAAALLSSTVSGQQTLLSVDFNQDSLSQWRSAHHRGEASLKACRSDQDAGAVKLSVIGKGSICDSWFTGISGISDVEGVKVKFGYKLNHPQMVGVAISGGPGGGMPCLRTTPSLIADGKWHESEFELNLRGFGQDRGVFEFILDGDAQAGTSLLLKDILIKTVPPERLSANWLSPGSKCLFENAAGQKIAVELFSAEDQGAEFHVTVRRASDGYVFQSSHCPAKGKTKISFDCSTFPQGAYEVVVELAGKTIGKWKFRKLPAKGNSVIVQNGIPYRNGEPFLVIGLYHVSQNVLDRINRENEGGGTVGRLQLSAVLKEIAERGFNVVTSPWGIPSPEYFQLTARHGLMVLSGGGMDQQYLDDVARLKQEPNLFGWYGLDEPPADKALELAGFYERLKAVDPYHPVVTAFCSGGLGYGDTRFVDIAMPDPYPVKSATPEVASLERVFIHGCRDVLLRSDPASCVIFIPQLFTNDGWGGFAPTYGQVRAETYASFIFGAKGIFYYAYYSHEPLSNGMELNPKCKAWVLPESTLWNQIGALNKELMGLKDFILLGNADNGVLLTSFDAIEGEARTLPDGRRTLVVVNPQAKSGEVMVSGAVSLRPLLPDSPKPSSSKNGQLLISLPGYGVGVYEAGR